MSDWQAQAACKGTPLRLWFHPHDGRHNYRRDCLRCAEALDVCAACPVRIFASEQSCPAPSNMASGAAWTPASVRG